MTHSQLLVAYYKGPVLGAICRGRFAGGDLPGAICRGRFAGGDLPGGDLLGGDLLVYH